MAEYIADSPRLMRIDLRENDIKTGGLMALSLSLKVSESVTRVDLDKDTKRESVSICCLYEEKWKYLASVHSVYLFDRYLSPKF